MRQTVYEMESVERTDDRTLKVKRRCELCGEDVFVYVRPADFMTFLAGHSYVQTLFPYLTADERELLSAGFCGPCFDSFCPPEED